MDHDDGISNPFGKRPFHAVLAANLSRRKILAGCANGNTHFPAPPDGVTIPRDATCVITRKDGGVIGS